MHAGVLGAVADAGGYLDVLDEKGMVVKEYINATMMDVSWSVPRCGVRGEDASVMGVSSRVLTCIVWFQCARWLKVKCN